MTGQECLNCRNYRPNTPADWKPAYRGHVFDLWALRTILGDYPQWNIGWPGRCLLQPVAVAVKSADVCGQWAVDESFLMSWSHLSELNRMTGEIARLKDELKAAQKLSLERYHRLQRVKPTGKTPEAQQQASAAQANGAAQ